MTTNYYTSSLPAPLDQVCNALQEAMGTPVFQQGSEVYCDDHGHFWFDYAWSETPAARVLLSRRKGNQRGPLQPWLPHCPSGASYQVALTADVEPPGLAEVLRGVLGPGTEHYASVAEIWTVDRAFNQPIQFVRQGGSEHFAIFTLQLSPNLDQPFVRFDSQVVGETESYYATFVEDGVRRFVFDWLRLGHPIGFLEVTVSEMIIHEMDTRRSSMRIAADMAMNKAMERHGICL